MKKSIFIEGDNTLDILKTVSFNAYESSKNNVLSGLTTFQNSKFIILANEENVSLLSTYSKDPDIEFYAGEAHIYQLQNKRHVNMYVVIHQAFFKLSGDGDLRKLGFNAFQMEEIITKNKDIFVNDGKKEWTCFFLIESGCGIYPISVTPFRHSRDIFEIKLESLSDLSLYAYENIRFAVPIVK